ncbi:MAG: Hpt domain-containing protein [Flavobacteriales bacterium]|nr:Hpt domain-containing protein [Flavobacteriales bacterium]NCP59310.1 Hpt domain-containing protein [Flavobacteriales bacterium]NCQ15318.1 Hpt domain-containing protein [Flavobacteriales bacterium]NCT15062.1 Hpt domain-containing protein [Flavobacteriales bacterium]PIV92589.1 MAG: Hpt domain-containing protein [Flavobacteriaceae bacterium CG17_big_fil_post_rev_8_21_14_2_50_33_15]
MEQHYKLYRVKELADNDQDFIGALAAAFLEEVPEDAERLKKAVAEKDYYNAYQAAHKMKPTIDLFELGVLDTLIEVQDWGKFEKKELDITSQLEIVLNAVDKAINEIRSDFNL